MGVRKEILKLRKNHDSIVDGLTAINRLTSSFETNLSKEERISISKQLKVIQTAVSKLKEVIPKE